MARGSVIKKGSNYYIVYRDPSTKKQKWKSAGSSKKKAEKMLTEIVGQIHRGTYRELKEITFKDFARQWLADYAAPRVKASTYDFYRCIIEVHLLKHFGHIKLTSISTQMIEEYLAKKIRQGGLSATSIGYHLRVLKTILKRAVVWGYLAQNPAEYIEKPRTQRKEMDFLNVEELNVFLETVQKKDKAYYPLFLTAALTGLRQGELLALKWSDINWVTNQIHVRRSLSMGVLDEPKSRAAIRAIIIPPILVSVFKRHKLSCPVGKLELVFPNEEGKIMDAKNMVKRHFLPALRKAGLRRIRFHDLRHTYASLLIAQAENLKFIQQQLGHASAQVTFDRYGHLMSQVQHGVGERLEKTVFGNSVRKVLENKEKKSQNDSSQSPELVGDSGFEPLTPCL